MQLKSAVRYTSLAFPQLRSGSCEQRRPPTHHVVKPLVRTKRRQFSTETAIKVHAAAGGRPDFSLGVITETDLQLLTEAAALSQGSVGLTQPHPNAACILVDSQGRTVGQAFQWAQGTECPELQAVRQAGPAARGSTAYLNLETGDCHGEHAGVQALVQAGVCRVVVGLRHPLPHLRGVAVSELRAAGVEVQVLGEAPCSASASSSSGSGSSAAEGATLDACLKANEALLHRAVTGKPLGLLKYAMTADGKIATASGHSAWVSSPESRAMVFETRARSDAVIVGGQTVRRDNPQLTTRRESGHQPVRVVMSRTLDLPEDAKLWDVAHAPTVVMTQRGARRDFQRRLRARGVEVVEFDFLTPGGVAAYCYERGFLQLLWECGGTLAAPAIAGGVIHKAMAFVAPKLIGGTRAPTPVGDLGFVEMTQALTLAETSWQVVGPDLLLTGYLPVSGGLHALAAAAAAGSVQVSGDCAAASSSGAGADGAAPSSSSGSGSSGAGSEQASSSSSAGTLARRYSAKLAGAVEFYKAWDKYGSLGNFSPHPITMPEVPMTPELLQEMRGQQQQPQQVVPSSSGRTWPSVEHYYQAQKFAGSAHPEAAALIDTIAAAASPEEAAKLGRAAQRRTPEMVREDWGRSQVSVMSAALLAKFTTHEGPRRMLLSTANGASSNDSSSSGHLLVESSPHDFYWGRGFDGSGQNMLGKLLMELRSLLLQQEGGEEGQQRPEPATLAA